MASVIHATGHAMIAGDAFKFANLIPTNAGPDEATTYYVLAAGLTADDFQFSDTPGGTAFILSYDITDGSIVNPDTYEIENDAIMSPPDTPVAPTGLTVTTFITTDADGHQQSVVAADLVHDTTYGVSGAVVEATWTDAGGSTPDWAKKAVVHLPLGTLRASFVVPGNLTVWVRAYAVTVYGATSSYSATGSTTSAMDTDAPATPTGLTILSGILGVVAKWNQNTEADLAYYEFQWDDNSGFTSPETKQFKGNLAVINGLAEGTWYVQVRAVDTSGNASAYCAYASAASRLTGTSDLDPTAVINQATNLINGTATVTVDDDGLHVADGAMFIEDEFGATVLVASGFSGSWSDFVSLGLYNARFTAGVAGTIPNGRTAALPYWTLSDVAGSPVATFMDPGAKVTFAALSNKKKFVSDAIKMAPGQSYNFGIGYDVNRAAGTLVVQVYFEVSDTPDFTFSSGSVTETLNHTSSGTGNIQQGYDASLGGNLYGRLVFTVEETVAHDAANYVTFTGAWLRFSPAEVGDFSITSGSVSFNAGASPPTQFNDDIGVVGDVIADRVIVDTSNQDVVLRRSAAKTLTLDSDGAGTDLTKVDMQAGELALPTTAYVTGVKAPVVNVYTTGSGNWTKPTGIHHIVVEVVGGGGGGGGGDATGASTYSGGAGGGGGGYARKTFSAANLSGASSFAYAVGAAGSAGSGTPTNGGTGGTSSFSGTGITTVQATGGGGGEAATATSGFTIRTAGGGGTGSGGDVNSIGSDGGVLILNAARSQLAHGGDSVLGGGAAPSGADAGGAGSAGGAYGGGGSGAHNGNSQSSRSGGAGAAGVVIVTEYYGP